MEECRLSMYTKKYSLVSAIQPDVKGQNYGHLKIIICGHGHALEHTAPPSPPSLQLSDQEQCFCAQRGFYMFPKLEMVCQANAMMMWMPQQTDTELRRITRKGFKQCMEAWVKWREHCISSSGCYSERNMFDWVHISCTLNPNILATYSNSYNSDSKKPLFKLNSIFLIALYIICMLVGIC